MKNYILTLVQIGQNLKIQSRQNSCYGGHSVIGTAAKNSKKKRECA